MRPDERLLEEARRLRESLHRRPELAFEEHETAKEIERFLSSHGVEILARGVAGTGLVALVRGRSEQPCVALRADMDALPIQEQTGLPWASEVDGKMHACGHDGHMAAVAAAAALLVERAGELAGSVKLIFQPAEERGNGARSMVEQGVLSEPDVGAIFAMHARPQLECGKVQVCSIPSANTDPFSLSIKGRGGHAAYPHKAADPIAAACQLVVALQQVVSRMVDPSEQAVVSVCSFHAGEAANVIPDAAELSGTIRTRDPETRRKVLDAVRRMAAGLPAALGTSAEIRFGQGTPRVRNDDRLVELARRVAAGLFGDSMLVNEEARTLGGEDFAYYLEEQGGVPGCMVWLGVECNEPVHSAFFDFGHRALGPAIELMASLAVAGLEFLKGED